MTTESFETRLQRFYDSCSPEEQQVVAAMCGLFVAAGQADTGDVAGYTDSSLAGSDSSALAFRAQQMGNAATQSAQASSNLHKKYDTALSNIVRRLH